jgi:hypothetical protein
MKCLSANNTGSNITLFAKTDKMLRVKTKTKTANDALTSLSNDKYKCQQYRKQK